MKKLLIAFSMIGAVALIACAEEAGSQSNSVTTNYAYDAWFSASANGTTINPVGGSFSKKADSESTFEAKNSKIEIDSEFDDPVSFKLNDVTVSLTTTLARVTFKLDPSVVPYSARPAAERLSGAKIAFALCENEGRTATNFCAWVGGDEWETLSDITTIPSEGSEYTLTMNFDESDGNNKKVQFKVGEETSAWFTYSTGLGKPQIDFVGSGKIKTLAADQVAIVSAEIDFGGGKVTIAEKDATAMGKLVPTGKTIEDVLPRPVKETVKGGAITISDSCTLSTAEAYAVGLIANENDTMVAKADGTFKVKADATAQVSDGIKVGFVTPLTPNDATAKITYKLMGSQTGAADSYKTEIVAATTDLSAIKIPTDKVGLGEGQCRYFKVVTTVDLSK